MIDVLLLEDSDDDAELLAAQLRRSGITASIRRADGRVSFLENLETRPDVVIADDQLPGYSSIEALRDAQKVCGHIPFIIFSGAIPETSALRAIREGADDFVMKDRPRRLAPAIEQALLRARQSEKSANDAMTMRAMIDALQSLSDQRRLLLDRLTSAQEDERKRIAGDVHDDHIQMMTAIALRIQLLAEDFARTDVKRELREIGDLLRQGIERLRRFMFDLYPESLVIEGLATTLGPYLETVLADAEIELDYAIDVSGAPEQAREIIAFRILQEAITNVRKHAEATIVEVAVELSSDEICARIEDNGRGLQSVETTSPDHIGLRTMHDRAELAGGFIEVGNGDGGGVKVEFWIPCGDTDGVSASAMT